NAHIAPREERVFLPFEQAAGLRRIGAKRVVQCRIARTSKRRKCRDIVIAIEIEYAAMKLIAAGASDAVYRSHSGVAYRKIEVKGRDLELLHSLLRKVLGRATCNPIINVRPVNRDAGHRASRAGDGDTEIVVGTASPRIGVISHGDSRLQ